MKYLDEYVQNLNETTFDNSIYLLESDVKNYKMLVLKGSSNWALTMDGSKKGKTWITPDATYNYENEQNLPQNSDFPELIPGCAIFSNNAVKILNPFLKKSGEILPISIDGKTDEYFIFNCTTVLDVLDKKKSTFKTFNSSGRIMDISKFFLKKDKITSDIFRLKDIKEMGTLFVSQRVHDIIKKSDLKGFILRRVS